jgi:hypothetical protein
MFIRNIGLQFSFPIPSLPDFGIRVILVSQSKLGIVPSSLIFLKEFEKDWHSLNVF